MAEYPIQGRLRFRSNTWQQDFDLVKGYVSQLSEQEAAALPGSEPGEFVWAEFGATRKEWREILPVLRRQDIAFTLYEGPELQYQVQKEREASGAKSPLNGPESGPVQRFLIWLAYFLLGNVVLLIEGVIIVFVNSILRGLFGPSIASYLMQLIAVLALVLTVYLGLVGWKTELVHGVGKVVAFIIISFIPILGLGVIHWIGKGAWEMALDLAIDQR